MEDLQSKRQRVECYTRVVGYIRPVSCFNEGKIAEYRDRVEFKVKDDI